jgi:hypothetical protein
MQFERPHLEIKFNKHKKNPLPGEPEHEGHCRTRCWTMHCPSPCQPAGLPSAHHHEEDASMRLCMPPPSFEALDLHVQDHTVQ